MVGIAAAIAFVFGASVLIAEIVSASTDEHGGGRNAVTGFGEYQHGKSADADSRHRRRTAGG
jgi:hypothetical protein